MSWFNDTGAKMTSFLRSLSDQHFHEQRIVLKSDWFDEFKNNDPNGWTITRGGWTEFSETLTDTLREVGFSVSRSKGRIPPVVVHNLRFSEKMSKELARHLFGLDIREGDFQEAVNEYFCNLEPLRSRDFGIAIGEDGRQGFRGHREGGEYFSFLQNSYSFRRSRGDTECSISETRLQQRLPVSDLAVSIDPSGGSLTFVKRISNLKYGQLANVDFGAVSVVRSKLADDVMTHALEIKKSNALTGVFKALAQVASYSKFANFVWICAPGLNEHSFQDAARFRQIMETCEVQGFGVIDVGLNEAADQVVSLTVQKAARRSEVLDPFFRDYLMDEFQLEPCRKCGAIDQWNEGEDAELAGCKWLVGEACARKLEEHLLSRLLEEG